MASHTPQSQPTFSTEKIQSAAGRAFWRIASNYQLTRDEQAAILGLKPNRQRLGSLEREGSIPDDPDKLLRAAHLISIHKNLRILFPHNRRVVNSWLKTRRKLFEGKSAMEYIMDGEPTTSIQRLFSVRRLLDQLRVGS